jgi:transposase
MNKYNGLSRYRQEKVIFSFCLDLTATQTALLLKLNRKTVNRYYQLFREKIYARQQAELERFMGVVEVDESYFGRRRPRGRPQLKRGRGTLKRPVFGVFERGGRVYTEIINDAKAKTLQGIIRGRVNPSSVILSDKWRGYDGLVDVGFEKHFRINHSKPFSRRGVHINGIESFWSFTKRRLAKFNGTKQNFHLHLKECEWRWNKTSDSLLTELKQMMG